MPFSQRHPIILLKSHTTRLIINSEHRTHLHAGVQDQSLRRLSRDDHRSVAKRHAVHRTHHTRRSVVHTPPVPQPSVCLDGGHREDVPSSHRRLTHQKYQRILRRNIENIIKTYELNIVTFGLSTAPYLAVRCLKQLAQDEGHRLRNTSIALTRDFYVDDALTGAPTFKKTWLYGRI